MNSSQLKVIRTIVIALIMGLLSFQSVALLLINDLKFEFELAGPSEIFFIILTVGSCALPVIHFFIDKNFRKRPSASSYSQMIVFRGAVSEGLALFSTVCTLLTQNGVFLIYFFVGLGFLISVYPYSASKVEDWLNSKSY